MKLILLLIAHLLGDYYFQPKRLVEAKRKSIKSQLFHSLLYSFIVLIFLIAFCNNSYQILISFIIIFVSHFVIDYFRIILENKYSSKKAELNLFFIDQIIHIIMISIVIKVIGQQNEIGDFYLKTIESVFNSSNVYRTLLIIFGYLLVITPASIIVKHILNYVDYRKHNQNESSLCEENQMTAGALIGKLERVLMLTFGLMGLYSSLALILTAKSLARFKQLENKDFAEMYLVGTLLSLIIAIFTVLIINNL